MVFPVIGGDGKPTGYEIDNSVRLSGGAELTFTPGQDGTKTTFTISCWAKKSENAGERQVIFGAQGGEDYLRWTDDEGIQFQIADASASRSHTSSPKFRDPSAWYHIVAIWNTTDGTNANRMQVYVNGGLLTPGTQPTISQNAVSTHMNDSSQVHHIGGEVNPANDFHFEGHLADFNFIDGSALDPTYFGETNDNGVWIPKKYTGSYGTNGFFLEFQQTGTSANSSGIGADTSGNDHHFAVASLAAIDITVDTPTNNFATLNPLSHLNITFSEGNVEGVRTTSGASSAVSTIAPSSGKWYFEFKNTGAQNSSIGVVNLDDWPSTTDIYDYSAAAAVLVESNANYNVTYGNTASSPTTLQNSADLVTNKYGLAMDIDNNDLYVSANGNWYGGSSFNQSDFSNATAVTTDLPSSVPLAFFVRGSLANTFYVNFGNPGGDDSISSGNADANGYGNFEYAVPSGYYALCTKNLAEYG